MWTVLTWILVPSLALYIGFNGVSLAAIIISVTSIIPIYIAMRMTQANLIKAMQKPLAVSLLMATPFLVLLFIPVSTIAIVITIISSIAIYFTLVGLWMRTELNPYLPAFFRKKRIL